VVKISHWKEGMELKGLKVIKGKTKVMCFKVGSGQVENGHVECVEKELEQTQ
jgi:hypothetical protein